MDYLGQSSTQLKSAAVILFLGNLLSESQVLQVLARTLPEMQHPTVCIIIFALSTLYFSAVSYDHVILCSPSHGGTLQAYEYLLYPVLTLELMIAATYYEGWVVIVLALIYLFLGWLIVFQAYFTGSTSREFASLSAEYRVIRLLRLMIQPLLLIIGLEFEMLALVTGFTQLVSIGCVMFLFSYRKLVMEYLVILGVIAGFASTLQNNIALIFDRNYYAVGEAISLYFLFDRVHLVRGLLLVKLHKILDSENLSDNGKLAMFSYIIECLFLHRRTLEMPDTNINDGYMKALHLMREVRNDNFHQDDSGNSLFEMEMGLRELFETDTRTKLKLIFALSKNEFRATQVFYPLEHMSDCSTRLKGEYVTQAMLLYYKYMERTAHNHWWVEKCKHKILHNKLIKHQDYVATDKERILFVDFEVKMVAFKQQVEDCLRTQLRFLDSMINEEKKQLFSDHQLVTIHHGKNRIRQSLRECLKNKVYGCSIHFKILMVLYHTLIEKKIEAAKAQIRKHFLLSARNSLPQSVLELPPQIVLHAQNESSIASSNQEFRMTIGRYLEKTAQKDIFCLLPSESQMITHRNLMKAYEECNRVPDNPHSAYQCYLAIEQEYRGHVVKMFVLYQIEVRLNYEQSFDLSYVCRFSEVPRAEGKLWLYAKDWQVLRKKGVEAVEARSMEVEQLDEIIEIVELPAHVLQKDSSNKMLAHQFDRGAPPDRLQSEVVLAQKLSKIERQLAHKSLDDDGEGCGFGQFMEILFVVFIVVGGAVLIVMLTRDVTKFEEVLHSQKNPLRKTHLLESEPRLHNQVLMYLSQRSYFPDDMCTIVGFSSLTGYLKNILQNELIGRFPKPKDMLLASDDYGVLTEGVFETEYSFRKLRNYHALGHNISYKKSVNLWKVSRYQMTESGFDYGQQRFNRSTSPVYPQRMMEYSLLGDKTPYKKLSENQEKYTLDKSDFYDLMMVVAAVFLVGVLLGLVVIRLRGSAMIISFLMLIASLPMKWLAERYSQIKRGITKLDYNETRLKSVDFPDQNHVEIQTLLGEKEKYTLKNCLVKKKRTGSKKKMNNTSDEDSEAELLLNLAKNSAAKDGRSLLWSLLLYNRWYLLMLTVLMVAIGATALVLVETKKEHLRTLSRCDKVSEQLGVLQEKYLNLVSYSWMYVFNKYEAIDMTGAEQMYTQALAAITNSPYERLIREAYDKDMADQYIHGDICSFASPSWAGFCPRYRDGLFVNGGLTAVVSSIANEVTALRGVTASPDSLHYILCERTKIYLQFVTGVTNDLPLEAMDKMVSKVKRSSTIQTVCLGVLVAVLMVAVVVGQRRRLWKEKVVREEALSLDSVDKMYFIEEYRPFLNSIYYSQ